MTHASGISALLSIVAFLLGSQTVHVQVVADSSIGGRLSTKQNFINLSGETPLPQGLLETLEGWDLQIYIVYNF